MVKRIRRRHPIFNIREEIQIMRLSLESRVHLPRRGMGPLSLTTRDPNMTLITHLEGVTEELLPSRKVEI